VEEGPGYFVSLQPDVMEETKMRELARVLAALAETRKASKG